MNNHEWSVSIRDIITQEVFIEQYLGRRFGNTGLDNNVLIYSTPTGKNYFYEEYVKSKSIERREVMMNKDIKFDNEVIQKTYDTIKSMNKTLSGSKEQVEDVNKEE